MLVFCGFQAGPHVSDGMKGETSSGWCQVDYFSFVGIEADVDLEVFVR